MKQWCGRAYTAKRIPQKRPSRSRPGDPTAEPSSAASDHPEQHHRCQSGLHVATALPVTPRPHSAGTRQGYPNGQWTVTSAKMQRHTEDKDGNQPEEEHSTFTGAAAKPPKQSSDDEHQHVNTAQHTSKPVPRRHAQIPKRGKGARR